MAVLVSSFLCALAIKTFSTRFRLLFIIRYGQHWRLHAENTRKRRGSCQKSFRLGRAKVKRYSQRKYWNHDFSQSRTMYIATLLHCASCSFSGLFTRLLMGNHWSGMNGMGVSGALPKFSWFIYLKSWQPDVFAANFQRHRSCFCPVIEDWWRCCATQNRESKFLFHFWRTEFFSGGKNYFRLLFPLKNHCAFSFSIVEYVRWLHKSRFIAIACDQKLITVNGWEYGFSSRAG